MKKFDKKYKKRSHIFWEHPLEIVEKAFSMYNITWKIIDLWCWQWRNSLYLFQKWYDIIGIDTSEVAINSLNQNLWLDKQIFYVDNIWNIFWNYDYFHIISTFTLSFLWKEQHQYIKKLQKSTCRWWFHIIQDFIENENNKRGFLSYDEVRELYDEWSILFMDCVEIETLMKDIEWKSIYWKTYRLIAKKNGL